MLVLKIYDCKLRKNRTKGAKQWRVNQNTTRVMWFNEYPYQPSYKEALYIVDNINKYFPTIKPQKNTRIEFYFTTNSINNLNPFLHISRVNIIINNFE